MNKHQASRTLLKSPPELWAECSDAQSLARHLDTSFGEIRITRLEPESTVAWEGERGSGTVKLEPSGWGTRVTLTCSTVTVEQPAADPEPAAAADPEPAAASDPEPAAAPDPKPAPASHEPSAEAGRGRLLARVMRFLAPPRPAAEPPATPPPPKGSAPEPPAAAPPSPEPPPAASEPSPPQAAEPEEAEDRLVAALDSLGQAHHRPFSRA
jgi:hypothetical protein